ncbi:hypothetical protein VTN77DRAFT_4952 [Rasamsonia byssochlamydoides]|uniref:uncharacterized protein n=1 Tax=Rasamsonia byssochlamydoides TaxID=89139 RepID=UPI003741EE25
MNNMIWYIDHHLSRGCSWVLLALIDTSSLRPDIEFPDRRVQVPVWKDNYRGTFVSMRAVWNHLGVDHSVGQWSEWFALDYIPAHIIAMARVFPSSDCTAGNFC